VFSLASACSTANVKSTKLTSACTSSCSGTYQAFTQYNYTNTSSTCVQLDYYGTSNCTGATKNPCSANCNPQAANPDNQCGGGGRCIGSGIGPIDNYCVWGVRGFGQGFCQVPACGYNCSNNSCQIDSAPGSKKPGAGPFSQYVDSASCQSKCTPPPPPPSCNSVIKGGVYDIDKQNQNIPITTSDVYIPGHTTTLASGNRYWIGNLCKGNYTVDEKLAGYTPSSQKSSSINVDGTSGDQPSYNFGVNEPRYSITGTVFVDDNPRNGRWDPSEQRYKGATINLTGKSTGKTTSGPIGDYTFSNLLAGDYTVSITLPVNYTQTTSTSVPITINSDSVVDFGMISTCTNSISGIVFEDNDKSLGVSPNDTYPQGSSVTLTANVGGVAKQTTSPASSNGAYSFSNLCGGKTDITISMTNKDTYSNPKGSPPTNSMTLGASNIGTCQNEANAIKSSYPNMTPVCSGGNVANLNFALTTPTANPWFTSTCGNMRIDKTPFDDPLPSGFAMLETFCSNKPAITYSATNAWTYGAGALSSKTWQVVDGNKKSPLVKLSYNYLNSLATQNNFTFSASPQCNSGNCNLGSLASGLYKTTGPVTISSYTLNPNGNIILLVAGDVTLTGDVKVSVPSTLTIVSNGIINVGSGVKTLEGIYAGSAISVLTVGGLPCPDSTLSVNGSLITTSGGSFTDTRKVCNNPSVAFTFRPDLLLNASDFIKHTRGVWQEKNP